MYNRGGGSVNVNLGSLSPASGGTLDGSGTPYNLQAGRCYPLDLGAACQLNFPSQANVPAPVDMDVIELLDVGKNCATYNVTINAGAAGTTFQSSGAATEILNKDGIHVQFIYIAKTDEWVTRILS